MMAMELMTAARSVAVAIRGRAYARGMGEQDDDDALTPLISRVELPAWTRQSRDDAERRDRVMSKVLQPRIDAHVAVYGAALDEVERAHQTIADTTDFDLTGETQWAAMWLVAGRCIGFARGVLVLAADGFGDEALPMARAAHEANRVLQAVGDPEELDMARRWLEDHDDRYVRPRHARDAIERTEQRFNAEMEKAGVEPAGTTLRPTREVYHLMSLVAHIRRQAIELVVNAKLRRMSRGRHPDPVGRALAVESHGRVVQETVTLVGDSFGRFFGPEYYRDRLKPVVDSFEAVREAAPLDPDTLRNLR
jgi:hypothetical protein